jgi:hypothetical protein
MPQTTTRSVTALAPQMANFTTGEVCTVHCSADFAG